MFKVGCIGRLMGPENIKKEVADLLTKSDPSDTASSKTRAYKIQVIVIVVLVAVGTIYGVYSFLTAPTGKITSPADGSQTSRIVDISGFAKNIPPESRYLWITIDEENFGICWPKQPAYKSNGRYKTIIYKRGPNKSFVVSLYAVDETCNEEILKWFEEVGIAMDHSGFKMLPKRFKLDSVSLTLQDM